MRLIDFVEGEGIDWRVVNDGVMGGLSQSRITYTGEGTGIFEGVLSLENNGGFASVRAVLGDRDLSAFAGVELRVRGDGRTYQLQLHSDRRTDGIYYRVGFETRAGEWITVRVPFENFAPTFRGRVVEGAPPLDTKNIHQMGLMLVDKQPGSFVLEIDYVQTWSEPESS